MEHISIVLGLTDEAVEDLPVRCGGAAATH
jgi:hypothetical protein